MPRFDGTGPEGYGPRTGRGFGRCYPRIRRFFTPNLKEEEKILEEELKEVRKALKDQKK